MGGGRDEDDDAEQKTDGEKRMKSRHIFFDVEFLKFLDQKKNALLAALKTFSPLKFSKKKEGNVAVLECKSFKGTWAVFLGYEYGQGGWISGSGIGFQLDPFINLLDALPEAIDQLEIRIIASKKRSDILLADMNPPANRTRKTILSEATVKADKFFDILCTDRFFTIATYSVSSPEDMWAKPLVAFTKKKALSLASQRNDEIHARLSAKWKKKKGKGKEANCLKKTPERTKVNRVGLSFTSLNDFLEVLYHIAMWHAANESLKKDRKVCSVKSRFDPNAATCCNSCYSLWKHSQRKLADELNSKSTVCPQILARTATHILLEAGLPVEYSRIFPMVMTIHFCMRVGERRGSCLKMLTFTKKEREEGVLGKTESKFQKNRFERAYTLFSPAYKNQLKCKEATVFKKTERLVKSLKKDAYRLP